MNAKKIITYVDPSTGEILKGTAEELTAKLGIDRATLYRRVKQNPTVATVAEIQLSHSTVAIPPVATSTPEPIQEDPFDTPIPVILKPPKKQDNTLHQEPCIKCKQPTFHALDGVYQCFNQCTPKRKIKKILYQPKPIAEGTNPYIKQVIEGV